MLFGGTTTRELSYTHSNQPILSHGIFPCPREMGMMGRQHWHCNRMSEYSKQVPSPKETRPQSQGESKDALRFDSTQNGTRKRTIIARTYAWQSRQRYRASL